MVGRVKLNATQFAAFAPSSPVSGRGLHVLDSGGSIVKAMVEGSLLGGAGLATATYAIFEFSPPISASTWTTNFPNSSEVEDIQSVAG